LSEANIPANIIAAFYHDHVLVPTVDAERARTHLLEEAHAYLSPEEIMAHMT
jgi:hypothetical protein